MISLRSLRV